MWRATGFNQHKEIFENLVKKGFLSHAYVFQGPDQIGKKLFAEDLFVLANNKSEFNPKDPDLLILSPRDTEGDTSVSKQGTKIYIEDIRDLKTFLSLRPHSGKYQFVIIDDAHRLTPEASNAFLKILEEPSGHVVCVLVTSQPEELLSTISSRCQHISFLAQTDTVISKAISTTKLSKPDQDLIIALARGRVGWAMTVSRAGDIKDLKQSVSDFSKMLKSPVAERMIFAKTMYEKQPYQEEVNYWLAWAYANRADLPNAHHVLTELLNLHQYIQQPQYNHRALLENTLINL